MFTPPFCPNKFCSYHSAVPPSQWWYSEGFHSTLAFGTVPRFRCQRCHKTFSVQTFSVHYWAKRIINLKKLERLSASSMGTRALSREFDCSCETITNRIDRLCRQGIMVHSQLRPQANPAEAVCFDGLVNFDRSQFFPNDVGISITAKSQFILALSHAVTRRSGSMTKSQKGIRDRIDEKAIFERKAIQRSFREQLNLLAEERPPSTKDPLIIITDEKLEYQRAFHTHPLFQLQDDKHRCIHWRISSKFPRIFINPLFSSNYIDREVRKDQANFRRETTNQSQNGANCMSRLYGYSVYHNYQKKFRIKDPVGNYSTHGEMAGIPSFLIKRMRETMFQERAFLSRLQLNIIDQKVWMKAVYDPLAGSITYGYLPKFASA